MVKVCIPTPIQKLTDNKATVDAEGTTVIEAIEDLEKNYPGVKAKLLKGEKVNRFINLYVDGDDIRFHEGLLTSIEGAKELSIVPAISGG